MDLGLNPAQIQAVRLSLVVAGWTALIGLPVGVGLAWVLSRMRFPGKAVLESAIHLPMVLPPVVTGYFLLVVLGKRGVVGGWLEHHWGIHLAFNWKGAVLASMVMALPLVVRAVRLSLEAVDRRLEQAARTLGAGRIRVFFTITLPLMVPGLIAGAILAFARSLGEFGATITFVSNIPGETTTLPLEIYNLTQTVNGERSALVLCGLATGISFLSLFMSESLGRWFTKRLQS
jgi:molybdate transport system permease protein